ncbi:hypothetical protein [Streptomyces sp. SID5910]|nr:hypothetical protein [Streptomyces sp. SID5910]MYR45780.1 hypothetical protein [Streptomyces sp. SID5910]
MHVLGMHVLVTHVLVRYVLVMSAVLGACAVLAVLFAVTCDTASSKL